MPLFSILYKKILISLNFNYDKYIKKITTHKFVFYSFFIMRQYNK